MHLDSPASSMLYIKVNATRRRTANCRVIQTLQVRTPNVHLHNDHLRKDYVFPSQPTFTHLK